MKMWGELSRFLKGIPYTFYMLPLLMLLVVPGVIAQNNEANLLAIPARSWLVLLGLSTGLSLALGTLRKLLGVVSADGIFERLIGFTCYFVVATGLLFPLAKETEMVDATEVEVDWTNLWVSLAFAAVIFAISQTRYRHYLGLGLIVFVVINAVVVFSGSALASVHLSDGDVYRASSERNIFVLSFDDLSGSTMWETLQNDKEAQEALGGFTIYRGVASSSPATKASIAAELYGNQNFKNGSETVRQVWDSSPENLITNVLAANDFEVITYGTYGTNLTEAGLRISAAGIAQVSAFELVNLSIARTLGSYVVPRGSLGDALRGLLYAPAPYQGSESELILEILNSNSPEWDKVLTSSVVDFHELVDRLNVGRRQATAYFLHFTHTHWPVEFDAACLFRGDDSEWYAGHQNYQGAVLEAGCALEHFTMFVEKVKSLGIYEQSMIVLKSDHGKPVGYARPGSIEAVRIEDHPYNGVSRYSPFLAIKPFGQASETNGVATDDSPVLLDDLARTICTEARIAHDCRRYPGYNIVDPRRVINPDSPVTFFVVETRSSSHTFQTHEPITFARGENLLTSLYQALAARGKISDP